MFSKWMNLLLFNSMILNSFTKELILMYFNYRDGEDGLAGSVIRK